MDERKDDQSHVRSPALPWASGQDASSSSIVEQWAQEIVEISENVEMEDMDEVKRGLPLDAVDLNLNDKIEVRWEVEKQEDTNGPQIQWWGARLVGMVDSTECEGRENVFTVRYDALHGFEECEERVMFVTDRSLYDLSEQNITQWRKEGEFHGDTTDCDLQDEGLFTLDELVEAGERVGLTEDFEKRTLENLPFEARMRFAEGLGHFKDCLQQWFTQLDPNHVIDTEDVAKLTGMLKDKKKKK